MKISWPSPVPGRLRFSYIEFEDEESMKLGIEKHAEVCSPRPSYVQFLYSHFMQKLKDIAVDVKQATDRESRGEAPHRGGLGGRGRGRGGFAAKGFAAAGLTRGGHRNPGSGSGDAGSGDGRRNSPAVGGPAGGDA